MSKTKRVVATSMGIWNGSRVKVGTVFTVPIEARGAWFVEVSEFQAKPVETDDEPKTMSEMNRRGRRPM